MTVHVRDLIADAYNRASLAAIYIDVQEKCIDTANRDNSGTLQAAQTCHQFSRKMRKLDIPNYWVIWSEMHEEGTYLNTDAVRSLPLEEQFKIVQPTSNEPVINKRTWSAITEKNQTLSNILQEQGKDTLMLLGVKADVCIKATNRAFLGFLKNVQTIIIQDGTNLALENPHEYLSTFRKSLKRHTKTNEIDPSRAHICHSTTAYKALGLN